jgi:hypothetical protein
VSTVRIGAVIAKATGTETARQKGYESESTLTRSNLTSLTRKAERANNEA